jgi:hypothetical protein
MDKFIAYSLFRQLVPAFVAKNTYLYVGIQHYYALSAKQFQ